MNVTLPSGLWATLLIVVIVIVVDAILGRLQSLKDKTFEWKKLPQFFKTGVLPYLGGMLILAIPAYLAQEYFLPVFYLIGTAVVAKYTEEMYSKLKTLFGVNLPQKLP
ncbi:MAG: hypothetical protein JXN10_11670 [Clostridia bacterium]|nr:hypothetical protein [Clostridia bacterium]MBN2884179.1 hypothetical protein [Clostridia bacterium]